MNKAFVIVMTILIITSCNTSTKETIVLNKEDYIDHHSYSNPQNVLVKHMDMDMKIDFDKKIIQGLVRYSLERKVGNELILDIRNLNVHKIFVDDKDESPGLNYTIGPIDDLLGSALTIDLPNGTTFLLYFLASSIATLTLLTLEAKVVKITLPGASLIIFSMSPRIFCSVGECSDDIAFVESEIRMSIPSLPISSSLVKSVRFPIGV